MDANTRATCAGQAPPPTKKNRDVTRFPRPHRHSTLRFLGRLEPLKSTKRRTQACYFHKLAWQRAQMKHDCGNLAIQGIQRRLKPSQHTFADVSLWWRLRRHHVVAPTRRVPRRPVHPPRARTLEWPPPCASISIYVCIYTCIDIYAYTPTW